MDIGSDTAPSRFDEQIYLGDGDRIAGFAAINAGFKFEGYLTTATFDSFFPVSGEIELRFGDLILHRDLIMDNVSSIQSISDIEGNGHTLEFSSSSTSFPNGGGTGDCVVGAVIDTTTEDDKIEALSWSFNSSFIAVGFGNNKPDIGLKIYEFDGITLTQRVSTLLDTKREVYDVRWHPTEYYFALGRRSIAGVNTELRIFEFDPVLYTITETSSKDLNVDVNAVAWHPSGNILAVGSDDTGAEIRLYTVDSSGVLSAAPVDIVDLSPNRAIGKKSLDWSVDGEHLAVGTKFSAGADVALIYEFDSTTSALTLDAGYAYGGSINGLDWNTTFSNFLAVGKDGGQKRLAVLEYDHDAATLTLQAEFGNPSGVAATVIAVDWGPCGFCLSSGAAFTSGAITEEFQTFEYDNALGTLHPISDVPFAKNIDAVRWSKDGSYIAIGGAIDEVRVYAAGCGTGTPQKCVVFSDLHIYFNHDMEMKDCCIIFNGDCSIDGRGHCIELSETTTLRVDSNSSLLLRDLTLKGMREKRLDFTDNTSTVSIQDATWILDSDYSFTTGRFEIVKNWKISGDGHTFAFQATIPSIIKENGKLFLDQGLTFSYDPPIASNQLFEFESATSEMHLSGATLHVTSTGLWLKKGIFSIDRESFISSDATVEAEGVIFGDGSDPANNVCLQGFPAVTADITQGIVVYNNVI